MADKASVKLTVDSSSVSEDMKLLTRRMQGVRKALESASPAQRQYGESLARSLGYMNEMEIEQRKMLGLDKQRLQEARRQEQFDQRRLATERKVTSEMGKQSRQRQRGGGGGGGRWNQAATQLAFGVDDFFSVQGGIGQRLRGAGNNLSSALSMIPGGIAAGVGLNIASQIASQLGFFDGLDEAFGFTTKKQQEAAEEMSRAAKAMEAAAKEQAKLLETIAQPLSGLDAAAQLSTAGRQRALRQGLLDDASGNLDDVRQRIADAQAELTGRQEEQALLEAALVPVRAEVARIRDEITAEAAAFAAANPQGGIPNTSRFNAPLQRALDEEARIEAALGGSRIAEERAELTLSNAEEPLRRAEVVDSIIGDMATTLDQISSIAQSARGVDVESLDGLVTGFQRAQELAQEGSLPEAQAALAEVTDRIPEVMADAFVAASEADETRREQEVRAFAEGAIAAIAQGRLSQQEAIDLARERFVSADLSTAATLDSRARIGVSDLRSGSELARLLSGDDGARDLIEVSRDSLSALNRVVELLEEEQLALAE